jgi:hypothetical protein
VVWTARMNPQITPVHGIRSRRQGFNAERRRDFVAEGTETNPNKAKRVKLSIMSRMCDKFIKQSQITYRLCFQRVGSFLGLFFGKNKCVRSMNCIRRRQEQVPNTAPKTTNWVWCSHEDWQQRLGAKLESRLESSEKETRLTQPSMNWTAMNWPTEA